MNVNDMNNMIPSSPSGTQDVDMGNDSNTISDINSSSSQSFHHVNKNKVLFNFTTTNARSIKPKVDSLSAYFNEHDLSVCVVAETWLTQEREKDVREQMREKKISFLANNRRN